MIRPFASAPALLLCSLLSLSAAPASRADVPAPGAQTPRPGAAQLKDMLNRSSAGFFNPMTIPTDPVPLKRLYTEWDETRALAVSTSLVDAIREVKVQDFYRELIAAAIQHVDVVVCYDNFESKHLIHFEKLLLQNPTIATHASRLSFAESRAASFWIRDFGPIFALSQENQLIAIDTIYRNVEGEMETFVNAPLDLDSPDLQQDLNAFISFRKEGRQLDVTPPYLAKHIRQTLSIDCDIVRPPLTLQGGDFIADGAGNVFISEDTILLNGGNKRLVVETIQDYFEAKEVHVLNAFPGNAARHLDLMLKFLSDEVVLYSKAPDTTASQSASARLLARQAKQAQDTNLAYLSKKFSRLRQVPLPSPALIEDSPAMVTSTIVAQVLATVCEEIGINYLSYLALPQGDPKKLSADKMIAKHFHSTVGKALNFNNREDLDLAAQHFLHAPLEQLESVHVSYTTVYRSYANSIILKHAKGTTLLLPRYRPAKGETLEQMQEMEKQVEAAYATAFPKATFEWINSDYMAKELGALHCVSITIPQVAPLDD